MDQNETPATGLSFTSVEDVKAFRVEVDALIQKARLINMIGQQDWQLIELAKSNVYEHLIEAKMWLGKCLEAFGNPFPAELADKSVPNDQASKM